MTKLRLFLTLLTLTFVLTVGYFASLIARGYRFDTKSLTLKPRGLFVITSSPDGAQVLVNNELESATNATIPLPPGEYNIQLKKEGYWSWEKHITIKEEEVTKIDAYLFPSAPSLSAITFTGAVNPILSPDGTKIVYGVPNTPTSNKEKVGIWVMDIADLPLGFSREPKKITDLPPENAGLRWSPDQRQILVASTNGQTTLSLPNGFYTIDSSTLTAQTALKSLTPQQLSELTTTWKQEEDKKQKDNLNKIPEKLKSLFKAEKITLSPDKTKVLYTATDNFTIPENILPQLPGSSTQQQERSVIKGRTYVYDLKEDRNFLVFDQNYTTQDELFAEASASATPKLQTKAGIAPPKTIKQNPPAGGQTTIKWFPTSNHLLIAQDGKISIKDYDNTNVQTIYSGPYQSPFAIPFPNTSRVLILTNLGQGESSLANLYTISLK